MKTGQQPTSRFALFAYGFRPFFLLAGWFAVVAMAFWLWLRHYPGGAALTAPSSLWHGHEILHGFVGAAIAGFMLTAVPNWTGSRGFAGVPLVLLTVVWLLGRIVLAFGAALPAWLVVLLPLTFLPLLSGLLAPRLVRATNRNTPLLAVLLIYWFSDAAFFHALLTGDFAAARTALQVALGIVLVLVTVIGGRIVPAFTGNALRRRGITAMPTSHPHLDRFVIGTMVLAIPVDLIWPGQLPAGLLALVAGLAQAARLSGWKGWRAAREPIVWVLHLAYLWLPIGLLLKAGWILAGWPWTGHWMHALGVGAAATMILAVMTRAALGHTGRELRAAAPITVAYVLLILAAAIRVFGPAWLPLTYPTVIDMAGWLWIAAFGCFALVYTPILIGPRADGRPG